MLCSEITVSYPTKLNCLLLLRKDHAIIVHKSTCMREIGCMARNWFIARLSLNIYSSCAWKQNDLSVSDSGYPLSCLQLRFSMSSSGAVMTKTSLERQLHRGQLHGTVAYSGTGNSEVQLVF